MGKAQVYFFSAKCHAIGGQADPFSDILFWQFLKILDKIYNNSIILLFDERICLKACQEAPKIGIL